MNIRKILGNFSFALVAQLIALAGNVITNLLVPKLMGVDQFGYWQLFILYGTYINLFHLGLNDGVYIINGGLSRDQVDRRSINSQFLIGMFYQFGFAVLLVLGGFFSETDGNRLFVLLFTGIYLLVTNGALYVGYLLQAMDETKRYSLYCAVNGILFLVPLVVLLALRVSQFQYYIVFYTLAHAIAMLICLWWVRDFAASGLLPLRAALKEAARSIRTGVKVMFASVASGLIINIARFFIDSQWGIEVFGMVSFALSIVSFFLLFTAQASMVLFPALRKAGEGESVLFFRASRDFLDLVLPVCFVLYFPACLVLGWWLPKYEPSFIYFAYLLPVVVYNGKMSMVGNTYLLVLRREGQLLWINTVAVAFSGVGALIGAFALHSIEFMIATAVIALMWRSIYVEFKLSREFGVPVSGLFVGSLVVMCGFLAAVLTLPFGWAFAVTAALYGVFLLIGRKDALALLRQLRGVFS